MINYLADFFTRPYANRNLWALGKINLPAKHSQPSQIFQISRDLTQYTTAVDFSMWLLLSSGIKN